MPLFLPISLRAYGQEVDWEAEAKSKAGKIENDEKGSGLSSRNMGALNQPTCWTFTFDTETTIDPAQRFRLGFYRLHDGDRLAEERLFIDAAALSKREMRVAALYCRRRSLEPPVPLEAFRAELLKAIAIGAMVVTYSQGACSLNCGILA
jgi:hypothetical protein